MLAKVIAWAPSRDAALRRLRRALADTVTLGVTTNVEFLQLLLDDPDVIAGDLDTDLIARRLDDLDFRQVDAGTAAAGALVLHALAFAQAGPASWQQPSGWRLGDSAASVYRLAAADAEPLVVRVTGTPAAASVTVDGAPAVVASVSLDSGHGTATARVVLGGTATTYRFAREGRVLHLGQGGAAWTLTDTGLVRAAAGGAAPAPSLRSPMPGAVVAVFVGDGQRVDAGDPVLSIEAMKMEHVLRAPHAGTVSLGVQLGAQVAADEVVATIESDAVDHEGATP